MYDFMVGDAISGSDFLVAVRSFLAIDLTKIPSNRCITNATLKVYQFVSYGDGLDKRFPRFQVIGGDTANCIADHITFGENLDSLDWTAGDVNDPKTLTTNIGVLSKDSVIGDKILDVTKFIVQDIKNGRIQSQFRIRFPIMYDNDGLNDFILFEGPKHPLRAPIIVVSSLITSVGNEFNSLPDILDVKNYPNPFNPSTTIMYSIPKRAKIIINVFNSIGQLVERLVNEEKNVGSYSVVFHGKNLSSGLYFISLNASGHSKTIKTSFIK